MAITFPRTDVMNAQIAGLGRAIGFTPPFSFEPVERQEISRTAGGAPIGKDFGPSLWFGTLTTEELPNDDALDYAALLNSLDGVIGTFEAWDLRRPTPRQYTDGSASDGVLQSVNANNKALRLSGLNAAQIVSRGDYLSFDYGTNRALHRVMETVTANGAGLTPEFEVRPHLRPGWELETDVNLSAPRGIFTRMPGPITATQTRGPFGVIAFQIVQYLE
jgi:hypothetical protein